MRLADADRRSFWLERAKEAPDCAGVYLMKAEDGAILYVGKAKNLRLRLCSYFQEGTSDYRAFVGLLGGLLHDLETVVTRSEKEALILERELIGRHVPRFNVIWKDDKQYLCLRVDTRAEFPWVQVVRNMGKDGARYFGPFHSASMARQTLRVVNRHFQLRTCRDSVLYNRSRPCLEYQIGRCPAPCVYEIDREKYQEGVNHVLMFLEGKGKNLIGRLERRMWEASDRLDYEVAAHYRNQKTAVERTLEKQEIALPSLRDQDVYGIHREGPHVAIVLLEIRKGRIKNVVPHFFERVLAEAGFLESFLLQRYAALDEPVPHELLVPVSLEGVSLLRELLSERAGRKVSVKRPARGERMRLMELAQDNAEHAFQEGLRRSGVLDRTLEGLRDALGLSNVPRRIECYDISNLGPDSMVGSRVAFRRGMPDKKAYRHYRIKSLRGQDDFKAMQEVLTRRFARGLQEKDLPELIVVDGGKGQLGVAVEVMRDLGIEEVDLISLAKSRSRPSRGGAPEASPERVFLPGRSSPIVLPQDGPELLLLARIRDEAHRFAIRFHRRDRQKKRLASPLDAVPGIGPVRRRALLRHLGSVQRIQAAAVEELAQVPGVGPKAAQRIWHALHPDDTP